jgi:hypothetical protein
MMQHNREGTLSRRHVLLGLGALSGAGAAAGTALTGSIGGTAVTGVDQAIVLDDDTAVNITDDSKPSTDSNGIASCQFQTTAQDNNTAYTISATLPSTGVTLEVTVEQGDPNS